MDHDAAYLEQQKLSLLQIQENLQAEYWRVQREYVTPFTIRRLVELEQQMGDNRSSIRAIEDLIMNHRIHFAEAKVNASRTLNQRLKNAKAHQIALQEEGQGSNIVDEDD